MSNWPFRFVHASDFHLETPVFGITDIPEKLRDLFLEAPFLAAERVFETVLAEDAEFLVLAGDILNPAYTGPRGPLLLIDQFERLKERDIPVYWIGGRVDPPEAWPPSIRLPDNVFLFPKGQTVAKVHRRDDSPLATVVGLSCPAGGSRPGPVPVEAFSPDSSGLYTVAVAYGEGEPGRFQECGIDYWALGGRHARGTLVSGASKVHYAGSPQGRHPEEDDVHGCSLVQVDESRNTRVSLIPTDMLRWRNERIVIDEATTREQLEMSLRERMHTLMENADGVDLLVGWTVAGLGPLAAELRRGTLGKTLLDVLREDYGKGSQIAWSTDLGVESSGVLPPHWYDQQTIRGDFLRAVQSFQAEPGRALQLQAYLPEDADDEIVELLTGIETAARGSLLNEVSVLGVDLLSPEEVA